MEGALRAPPCLLVGSGCAAKDDGALSAGLLQGLADGLKPSAPAQTPDAKVDAPTPSPDAGAAELDFESWGRKLVGFWVEVDRFADANEPLILFFDEAGRAYVGMDNNASKYDGGEPAAAWAMENGAPYIVDHASGDKGRIELDASGTLRITWGNAFAWILNRPDTPLATSILMKSELLSVRLS